MIPRNDTEMRYMLVSQVATLEHGIALFNVIKGEIQVFEDKPRQIDTTDILSLIHI